LPKGPKTLGIVKEVNFPSDSSAHFSRIAFPFFLDLPYKLSLSSWVEDENKICGVEFVCKHLDLCYGLVHQG